MGRLKSKAVIFILISSFLTTFAQIMYKFAADWLVYTKPLTFITNYFFIIGLFLYGTAGIFSIKAFKYGDVSVVYPLFASSYILVILFSHYIFGEVITSYKWIGVIIIMLGITIASLGTKKKSALEYQTGAA